MEWGWRRETRTLLQNQRTASKRSNWKTICRWWICGFTGEQFRTGKLIVILLHRDCTLNTLWMARYYRAGIIIMRAYTVPLYPSYIRGRRNGAESIWVSSIKGNWAKRDKLPERLVSTTNVHLSLIATDCEPNHHSGWCASPVLLGKTRNIQLIYRSFPIT